MGSEMCIRDRCGRVRRLQRCERNLSVGSMPVVQLRGGRVAVSKARTPEEETIESELSRTPDEDAPVVAAYGAVVYGLYSAVNAV